MSAYVYILASKPNGTLYLGVTSDLVKRIYQHKSGETKGFTERHDVRNLVYFEIFDDIRNAIEREKALKFRKRKWKIELIEKDNPHWLDLYTTISGP